MAMNAGDNTVQPGTMARAIYDRMVAAWGDSGSPPSQEAEDAWKQAAAVFANGIVDNLASNADVRVTTSDGGLQTGADAGNPTTAPGSDQVLSGALE